jgi:hypothetical protein
MIPDPRTQTPRTTPFLILSYFTEGGDGRYAKASKAWLEALEANGHRAQALLYRLSEPESWRHGAMWKPTVIEDVLWNFKAPVLWIDIDALVRGPLDLDVPDGIDMASNWRKDRNKNASCWPSGTLFFNPTNNAKKLISNWSEYSRLASMGEGPFKHANGDQEILGFLAYDAIKRGELAHHQLPRKWCFIYDIDRKQGHRNPLIEHFQASRGLPRSPATGLLSERVCRLLPEGVEIVT